MKALARKAFTLWHATLAGPIFLLGSSCVDPVYVGTVGSTPVVDGGGSDVAWRVTFFDDFVGAAGTAPAPERWTFDVGANVWGNDQVQYYTARRENSYLDGNGNLVIQATGEDYMASAYTSARLKTQGLFAQTYGRFEVRARVPVIAGLGSSFWLMGEDFPGIPWPDCGDINILSFLGDAPQLNRGGLHGPGFGVGDQVRVPFTLPDSDFGAAFHILAVEWEPESIRFFVDDVLYGTRTPGDLPAGARWVQDHPFFLLLHLSVNGRTVIPPLLPQTLVVDSVRVLAR